MLRFAFSPTHDLSLDELRLALLNFIVAKQRSEDFIVRVEDTSKRNVIEGKDKESLDLLDLFGIRYTQTIYQSQNFRFHSAMALQLMHEGKAFSCFCSPEWIQGKINDTEAAKKPYLYDDACANLPAELVIDNTNPFTVRIYRPQNDIAIKDHLQGDVTFKADTIDSFMILKQDKTPMADFASGIDDMLNDISLVIKSQEDVESTPKQVYLRDQLEYNKQVEYIHLAPIGDDETPSVRSLLEQGYLPETIVNYLLSMDLEVALEKFDIKTLLVNPKSFSLNDLKELNKECFKNMDAKELSRYVGFADAEIGELARLYVDQVQTTKELKTKIAPIFEPRVVPEELQEQYNAIKNCAKQAPYFDQYDDFKAYIASETGLDKENISQTLRILLSNAKSGPDLAKIYQYIKNYLGEFTK
ncbi:glutamate--tRNA ligase [Sulfurimonas sp.]|uniref:glutamate--tRNA ligase n=1 Tax=Sulfurimonas sp. TaxID=2022749 RepID=UPI003D14CD61